MKIDTCIIVKNEEENIEKLIRQFLLYSNEIHITDTGSTDNTINIINSLMSEYNNIFLHHFEWCMDFAKARNYSLTCYECNADYQFWCDGDDELNYTLIDTLRKFDGDADIYIVNYLYDQVYNFYQQRSSLLKVSSKLEWKDPIHEYIDYGDNCNIDYSLFDNGSLIIHHIVQNESHGERNLNIFKNMEADHYNFTCRNRYYYGVELYFAKMFESAAYQLTKCIDDEEDNKLDKINACRFLFSIDGDLALQYFFKLFSNEENIRKDLLYGVGNYFFNKKQYKLAKFYYSLCINWGEPPNHLLFYYDTNCHINSLLQLGLLEYNDNNIKQFEAYNNEILKLDPNNEIAKYNLSLLNEQ